MSIAPPDLPREAKCIPPVPVPTHGPGGVFTVACTTDIAGPAIKVLERVLDLPHYGSWNTFVPRASVISTTSGGNEIAKDEALAPEVRELVARPGFAARGAKIRFDVVMSPGGSSSRAVELEVTVLETFTVHPPTSTTASATAATATATAAATEEDGEGGRKGYRVAWKATGMPHFLLHSERVQEFVESVAEDGSVVTRYTTWETFGGVLGYVLPRTQIEGGFDRWAAGLKKVVEEGGE